MSGNTWERAKHLFHEAIGRSAGERAAFLERECGSDDRLRAEVDALIEAHEAAGSFLGGAEGAGVSGSAEPAGDRGAAGSRDDDDRTAATPPTSLTEGPGTVIGRYKLLQLIGEGGFGSVYMAEQERPVRRKVALKIIKLGMDTKQVIARFEAERQALALMDHPNIARVLDAGATETGRPYFVMELVRGVPITTYCDQNNLATEERLRLFQSVCGAVQHAHQKGIIHRDIKPSNVMVTLHDGTPVPKVIDFGIAKATNQRLTEKTLFTEYRQFIGTPQYMSPEQAEMSGLDVDTRTDIYSLGVLLYELLTGTTPFDPNRLRSLAFSEIHRVIREEDPHKPSTRVSALGDTATDTAKHRATDAAALRRRLSGDLDWIVMKALEKDRTRRYETANALVLDISRHLENEPVLASPPKAMYRMRKFVRRNRTAVAVIGAVGAALLVGFGLAMYGLIQADRERAIARQEAESAVAINDFFNDMLASVNPAQYHRYSPFLETSGLPDMNARFERGVSVVDMLRGATARIGEAFDGKPLLEARARETMATTLLGLGAEEEAIDQFEAALETRRTVFGEGNREVNRSRLLLAMANFEADYQVTAQKLVQIVLVEFEKTLNPEDPSRLFATSLYGATQVQQGEHARADSIFEEVLEKQRRVLGPKHRDTIWSLLQWAGSYCWRGNGPVAERLAGEAYRNAIGTYSPDDAIVLQAASYYALALTFRARDREAEEIARPALERATRVLGKANRIRLFNIFALARALSMENDSEEMDALYDEYRNGGWSEWVGARDLGDVRMWLGNYDGALEVLREEHLHWNEEERRYRHVKQARLDMIGAQAAENYRRALAFLDRWDEVRTLLREEIEIDRAAAEREEATADDWNRLAWLLATCEPKDMRRPEEALRWANRAVEAVEEGELDDPAEAANIFDTQAKAFHATGDLEGALAAARISVERFARAGDRNNLPAIAAMAVRYVVERDGIEAARKEVARTVELCDDAYGAGTEDLAEVLGAFGLALENNGHHEFADLPYRKALTAAEASGSDEAILDATINIAHSRLKLDNRREAATALEEAKLLYRELYAGDPIEWTPGLGYSGEGERSTEAVGAKTSIALGLIEIGRLDEAEVLIEQIRCVQESGARYAAARLLLAGGDSAAEEAFRRQLWSNRYLEDSNPARYAEREIYYARALLLNGKRAEARHHLERARERALEWCGSTSSIVREADKLIAGI